MQKVALYSDFKDLYDKLMPSLAAMQAQVYEISVDHNQNKDIVKRISEQMGLCATKFEILEYGSELRKLLKESVFREF